MILSAIRSVAAPWFPITHAFSTHDSGNGRVLASFYSRICCNTASISRAVVSPSNLARTIPAHRRRRSTARSGCLARSPPAFRQGLSPARFVRSAAGRRGIRNGEGEGSSRHQGCSTAASIAWSRTWPSAPMTAANAWRAASVCGCGRHPQLGDQLTFGKLEHRSQGETRWRFCRSAARRSESDPPVPPATPWPPGGRRCRSPR